MFYQLRNIVFVDICDIGEDQITFHEKFKQKTKKLKMVHLLFLATVYMYIGIGINRDARQTQTIFLV